VILPAPGNYYLPSRRLRGEWGYCTTLGIELAFVATYYDYLTVGTPRNAHAKARTAEEDQNNCQDNQQNNS